MNDIERILHIEQTLGIRLNRVSLENLFTEKSFYTKSVSHFSLSELRQQNFYWRGVRNYSIDEKGNIIGLAMDFCDLLVLEDNFLQDFESLQKLKLKSSFQKDYSFLFYLKELKELDLSANNLLNASFLNELKGLTTLNLSFNSLSNADFLKELKNLTTLYLSNNNLSNYDFLKELKSLTTLDLSNNDLRNHDFLKELKGLTMLYLRNNKLPNYDFLSELKDLTSIDLSFNNLSNADFLKELRNLTTLDLSLNNLSSYDFLKRLTNLRTLDLSFNNLSNADFLKELTSLTTLYLKNNNLSNADFLKELKGLEILNLNDNSLKIAENVLRDVKTPLRIIAANFGIEESIYQNYKEKPEKIWALIEAKLKKPEENKALLECRLVLIGQGNAGKTSLMQRLLYPELKKLEDRGKTEGVEIDGKYFKVRNENIWVNVWDFGGQEVYHATHKFFFRERCLYILVVDVRAGMESYIVKYWLRQIKELAKSNAPLIIVANKAENTNKIPKIDKTYKHKFDSLLDEFKEIYPNIKGLHYVSTNKPLNTETVKKEVIDAIDEDLPEVFTTYPSYYSQTRDMFKVKKGRKSKFGNFISKEDFEKQLNDEAQNDDKVVEILDILGVFCHFKQNENEQDDELEKLYVLNPEWITKGVYKILSSYILAEKSGKVDFSDIRNILNRSEYQEKHNFIIKLMRRFKLCFVKNYQDKDYIIFPTWLPVKEASYSPFITKIAKIEYEYESENELEKAITNYIVDAQSSNNNENDSYWRRGIVIRETGLRSLVKADMKTGVLTITVEGEEKDRTKKLDEIKRYFSKFHNDNEIKVEEIKYSDIGKIEEIIKRSVLPDKYLLEEIPKLENEIKTLNEKIQTTKLLKEGYETLENIAELEKIYSQMQGLRNAWVSSYFLCILIFLCILFGTYVLYYVKLWSMGKNLFQESEHFTYFVLSLVPLIFSGIWFFFFKNKNPWEVLESIIDSVVTSILMKSYKEERQKYEEAQSKLASLSPQIEKAKQELGN